MTTEIMSTNNIVKPVARIVNACDTDPIDKSDDIHRMIRFNDIVSNLHTTSGTSMDILKLDTAFMSLSDRPNNNDIICDLSCLQSIETSNSQPILIN